MVLENKISEVEHDCARRAVTQNPWVLGSSEPTPKEPLRRRGAQGGSGSSPPTGSPFVGSRLSQYRKMLRSTLLHSEVSYATNAVSPTSFARPSQPPSFVFFSKSLNFFNCSDIISLDTCGFDASWCDTTCLVGTCRLFDVTVTRQEFVVSAEKKTAGRNRASVFGKRRNSSTKL